MRKLLALIAALITSSHAAAQAIYPAPVDMSGLMTVESANASIGVMNARIDSDEARLAALEAKRGLTQVAAATVGETTLLSLGLGVRRYNVSAPGTVATDRIMLALTAAPSNCTLQDAYVTTAGTISVGVLVPAVGLGATIACPLVLYKVG